MAAAESTLCDKKQRLTKRNEIKESENTTNIIIKKKKQSINPL